MIITENVANDLNYLFSVVSKVKSFEDAINLDYANGGEFEVEINGYPAREFDKEGNLFVHTVNGVIPYGKQIIEWVRIEDYSRNLQYIYFYIEETSVWNITRVVFDIYEYDDDYGDDYPLTDCSKIDADKFPIQEDMIKALLIGVEIK